MNHMMVGWHEQINELVLKCVLVTHCPTLCEPMDCSLPGSLSMEFFKQEYWSALAFPSPEDLPNPGVEHRSPTLHVDSLPSDPVHLRY